jgi:hypothetical protein
MPRKIEPTKQADDLKKHGWTRQFVAAEPRLTEAVQLYQTIGYEVHLESVTPENAIESADDESCTVCFEGDEDQYKIIYTRPKKETPGRDDDLW